MNSATRFCGWLINLSNFYYSNWAYRGQLHSETIPIWLRLRSLKGALLRVYGVASPSNGAGLTHWALDRQTALIAPSTHEGWRA